jgi:DSF synthase
MELTLTYTPRRPQDFPHWTFPTLDLEYDAPSRSVWMYYKADGPPYYTFQTLTDMADVRESLRGLAGSDLRDRFPVRYFAMASRKAGVFNLGGDLAMFANAIRTGDRSTLRAYAHACIDVVYGLSIAFDLPIVTVSVITGQALGGGLESALGLDFLLAETTARIGVPEVAFNTFPGMGAVSMLTRRLGTATAEAIISSGKVYSGQEMHDLGVIHMLAPDGGAHASALAWMREGDDARYERRLAIARARRHWFSLSHDELIRITDLWADCSCDVAAQDLRYMDRLVAAQKRLQRDLQTAE